MPQRHVAPSPSLRRPQSGHGGRGPTATSKLSAIGLSSSDSDALPSSEVSEAESENPDDESEPLSSCSTIMSSSPVGESSSMVLAHERRTQRRGEKSSLARREREQASTPQSSERACLLGRGSRAERGEGLRERLVETFTTAWTARVSCAAFGATAIRTETSLHRLVP